MNTLKDDTILDIKDNFVCIEDEVTQEMINQIDSTFVKAESW